MPEEKRYYNQERCPEIVEFPAAIAHFPESKVSIEATEVELLRSRAYNFLPSLIAEAAIRDWGRQRKEGEA